MRDIPFEKTVGGRILLEKQLPELLRKLHKIREAAERIALALERSVPPKEVGPWMPNRGDRLQLVAECEQKARGHLNPPICRASKGIRAVKTTS